MFVFNPYYFGKGIIKQNRLERADERTAFPQQMAVTGRVSKLNRYQITRQTYVTTITFDNKFVVYLPNDCLITIGIIIH